MSPELISITAVGAAIAGIVFVGQRNMRHEFAVLRWEIGEMWAAKATGTPVQVASNPASFDLVVQGM